VYIVVKTFAASMAAIITSTYAENSYVLKNALILHHELSMGAEGNTSKHKASLAGMIRWQEVLFAPIAKRKGISVDQFVDGLYKIKRDGDAVLFATDAVKEQWIFNTIDSIEDGSFTEITATIAQPTVKQLQDEEDRSPEDFYHIYRKAFK
jgi:ATP-dependent protease ClpP protease subunit